MKHANNLACFYWFRVSFRCDQLALTAAPPSSEIFVFTDAPAKDIHLKGAITALIESSKSVVSLSVCLSVSVSLGVVHLWLHVGGLTFSDH